MSETKPEMWIGTRADSYREGEVGFLVQHKNEITKWSVMTLRDTPAARSRNFEPVLEGFCGEHNDVRTYACGVWEVVQVLANGRSRIQELRGDEMKAALTNLGYPELFK
jgi:hypothetical protein